MQNQIKKSVLRNKRPFQKKVKDNKDVDFFSFVSSKNISVRSTIEKGPQEIADSDSNLVLGDEYSIHQETLGDLDGNPKDEKHKLRSKRIKLVSKQDSEMLITAPTPLLPLNIYNEQSGRTNNNIIESGGYALQHVSTIRRKKKEGASPFEPVEEPSQDSDLLNGDLSSVNYINATMAPNKTKIKVKN